MPKIDPLQLLNCLKILLSENGGIGSSKDVSRVAGLMNKYSKKLVSKCIYIQILKCTNTDLLEMFMSANGWDLVYNWLVDAISKNNWILVQEVLELFLLCPVDTTRLKSNSAPKVVKNLSISGGTSVVKHLATKLVDQWLYIVKSQTPSIQSRSKETTPVPEFDIPAPTPSTSPSIKILLKDGKQVLAKINVEKTLATATSEDGSSSPSHDSEKDEIDESKSKEKKEDKSSTSSIKSSHTSSKSSRHKSSSSSNSSSKKSSSSSSSSSSKSSSSDKDKDRHRSSSKSTSSSKSSSSDKDRHRSSSKSSREDRDKDRHSKSKDRSSSSSKDSRDKNKESSSSSGSSSNNKDRDNRSDKEKSEKASDRDKILEKLAKISKKTKEEDSPTSITVPSKKASISIEIKRDTEKSSAVKTYKSQFRSHGLTEEAPPPPSRKGLKKPPSQPVSLPPSVQQSTTSAPAASPASPPPPSTTITTSITNSLKRSSPPLKESPTEKRAKIDIISSSPSSIPEKVGGVKLIAPKPKPSALVETNIFSDALSASMAPKKDVRKRKMKTKDSPSEPESPQKTVAPLKFYQDTLDDSNKKDDASKAEHKTEDKKNDDLEEDEDDIPLKKVKEDIKKKEEEAKANTPPVSPEDGSKEEDDMIEENIVKPPGPGCGPDGPPGVLSIHRRRGPKKKLTWKPEAELEQIRYFESDENERVNVTKTSFMDMTHLERCSERDAMLHGKRFNPNDNMLEQTGWVKPFEIDGDIPVLPMGSGSKEKIIQQEREKNTLKTIYFTIGMIPDSPAEADFEHYVPSEPVVIPIDDVTGNPDTVNDFTGMAWPEAKMGGGEDVVVTMPVLANENPFKPINPFSSNTFLPFPQNENWINQGPPQGMGMPSGPMNMNGPPVNINMNGPHMNMDRMPMRSPQFFNGPPNQFGPPPPNFGPGPGPNMMMNCPPNNFGPPPNQMNFNNGPPLPRNDFGNNNRRNDNRRDDNRGGWRTGNSSSENWRNGPPAGPGDMRGGPRNQMNMNNNRGGGGGGGGGGPPPSWLSGPSNNGVARVCKQFLRGNCRNNRCNFIHPKKF